MSVTDEFTMTGSTTTPAVETTGSGFSGDTTQQPEISGGGFKGKGYGVNADFYSSFASDSRGLAVVLADRVSDILKNKGADGKATIVNFANSGSFTGLVINLKKNGKAYTQPLIVDERTLKTVKELMVEDKNTQNTIVFGTVLLFDKNKSVLDAFNPLTAGTIKLDPLLIIADAYKGADAITELALQLLLRIDAKPFTGVADEIKKDKSYNLNASVQTDGQEVTLVINQNEKYNDEVATLLNNAGSVLSIKGRVDGVLGKKHKVINGMNADVFCLRPIFWLTGYNKPGTSAAYNIEYGLFSIACATIMLSKDKYFSALMPTMKHKTNIGALNPLMNVSADATGAFKPLNLLDAKLDQASKNVYMDDILGAPGIGIDIEYRCSPSALHHFGVLNDNEASVDAKQNAANAIKEAYKNVTGFDFPGGEVTEKVIQYPTGTATLKNGTTVDLKTIDAIWIASLGGAEALALAEKWIISDHSASDSYLSKLDVLSKLCDITELSITIRGVGYRMILSHQFMSNLINHVGMRITSPQILDVSYNQTQSFANMVGDFKIYDALSGVGQTPTFQGGNLFRILG